MSWITVLRGSIALAAVFTLPGWFFLASKISFSNWGKSMKIALIAPTYLPALRANTIQVMKMGQAMAELGHNLRVLVPRRDMNHPLPTWDELSHHYGLELQFVVLLILRCKSVQATPSVHAAAFGEKSNCF